MQRLRFALGLVCFVIVSMLSGLVLAATALPLGAGWDRVVLTSGSMAPLINPGDIVLTAKAAHPVKPGTVVVFENPNKPGSLITHRVVEVLPDGRYRTKGDANPQADVSPVAPENVVGSGAGLVPLVGLPAVWVGRGYPALAASAVVLALLLAWLSRYGLLSRYDPWLNPGRAGPPKKPKHRQNSGNRTRTRKRAGASAGAAMAMIAALAGICTGPQPSHGAYTASTSNSGNQLSTAPPPLASYYLQTNGTGDVKSSGVLPLSSTAPTQTTLYNYDTNRDTHPGLLIAPTALGLDETAASKIQRWHVQKNAVNLAGNVRVTLWSAMNNFSTTKSGSVTVGLYDCDSNGNVCTPLANKTVTSTGSWSGGSGTWVAKEFDLGPINRQTTMLQLRVVVPSSSQDSMMFAYGTVGYPSKITVHS